MRAFWLGLAIGFAVVSALCIGYRAGEAHGEQACQTQAFWGAAGAIVRDTLEAARR